WGPDLEFIGEAMKYAKSRCSVKDDHVGLAGFSDGASYALSMGIGNGDVFSRIMAMSPGIMQPAAVRGKPKIFISHGVNDQVMPIDITRRRCSPARARRRSSRRLRARRRASASAAAA